MLQNLEGRNRGTGPPFESASFSVPAPGERLHGIFPSWFESAGWCSVLILTVCERPNPLPAVRWRLRLYNAADDLALGTYNIVIIEVLRAGCAAQNAEEKKVGHKILCGSALPQGKPAGFRCEGGEAFLHVRLPFPQSASASRFTAGATDSRT